MDARLKEMCFDCDEKQRRRCLDFWETYLFATGIAPRIDDICEIKCIMKAISNICPE